MKQSERISLAKTSLEICKKGVYVNDQGQSFDLSANLQLAINGSRIFTPETLAGRTIERDQWLAEQPRNQPTRFEVANERTLEALYRLNDEGASRIFVLNFASAKNPGGGFLNGAKAQEESLARSGGLFPAISAQKEFYQANKEQKSCIYLDQQIYTPQTPFWFNDDGERLRQPVYAAILTAPAVNAGVVKAREKDNIGLIEPVMLRRTEMALSIAALYGHDTLVLGAWGCGVFQNDPELIADCFARQLLENPLFVNAFRRIVFAVYCRENESTKFEAFKMRFSV